MNKIKNTLGSLLMFLFLYSNSVLAVQQTICFSNNNSSTCTLASLGDNSNLDGGQCRGSTLKKMNRQGWRLVFIGPEVGSCSGGFSMLFEKK